MKTKDVLKQFIKDLKSLIDKIMKLIKRLIESIKEYREKRRLQHLDYLTKKLVEEELKSKIRMYKYSYVPIRTKEDHQKMIKLRGPIDLRRDIGLFGGKNNDKGIQEEDEDKKNKRR